MSSNPNPNNSYNDFRSATQWAHNYNHNPNGSSNKDNNITIFWIVIVVILLALSIWWLWSNNKRNTQNQIEPNKSPLNDLKNGAQNPTNRLIIKPNGNVASV